MHRDLKPDNIFILVVGEHAIENILKLGDFGLIKDVNATLIKGSIRGTEGYKSPELHYGEGYGKSSDIWAAGVILFEMFAGYHPFEVEEGVFKILDPPKDLPSYVPSDIKDLILNLLQDKHTERKTADKIKLWLIHRKNPPREHPLDNSIIEEAASLRN
jgi:serine/threonine protein kinase